MYFLKIEKVCIWGVLLSPIQQSNGHDFNNTDNLYGSDTIISWGKYQQVIYGAVLFVVLATLICGVARRLLNKALPAGSNVRRYGGEIIATFQLVTGMLEGDVVMEVNLQ